MKGGDGHYELYRKELRLWLNLYLPSVKLLKKVRVGSKLRRKYSEPQTPFQRVWICSRNPGHLAELKKLNDTLDPFRLAEVIEEKLNTLYQLTAQRHSSNVTAQKQTARGWQAGAKKRAGERLWKRRTEEK